MKLDKLVEILIEESKDKNNNFANMDITRIDVSDEKVEIYHGEIYRRIWRKGIE